MKKGSTSLSERAKLPAGVQLLLDENAAAEEYRREKALSDAARRRTPGRTRATIIIGLVSVVVHPLIPVAAIVGASTAKSKGDEILHGNNAEEAASRWRVNRATRLATEPQAPQQQG